MMIGKWWRAVGAAGKYDFRYDGVRTMVGKASNRAGVHGSHLPDSKTLENEEEIRERINKGKEDKTDKRKKVEERVEESLRRSNGHDASSAQ